MPISTPLHIHSGRHLTNSASYDIPGDGSSSISFQSGRLYLMALETDTSPPDIVDLYTFRNSPPWILGKSFVFSDDDMIGYWYVQMTGSLLNTIISVDTNQGSTSNLRWSIIEIASGFNTTTPIKQTSVSASAATTASVPHNLPSAPDADSVSIIFAANATNDNLHSPTLYVELGETGVGGGGSDAGNMSCGYASPAVQTASTVVDSGTATWAAFHIEIDAGEEAPAVGQPPSKGHSQVLLIGF